MNKVSVTIDGIEYQITGEKKEAEIVKVAKYIDSELRKISKAAPSLSKTSAAILTSVNIADKLFDNMSENEELKNKIQILEDSYSNKNDDIEKEFDSILLKLDESETEIKKLNNIITELESNSGDSESQRSIDKSEVEEEYKKKIESLEKMVDEMEKKVAVAENMADEFQNKAYNIQLNYEELKKSIK
ncbi:cell division protein ZapA [Peptostreptococcus faecalis]|uniref:cell division protein ZapA n=1 Tax=Peptostreptococcus faecalis TaxID=2045015 RepID=UPI000C797785|nr:cell division protein ZapA [Peptostreptococcus faecalis]